MQSTGFACLKLGIEVQTQYFGGQFQAYQNSSPWQPMPWPWHALAIMALPWQHMPWHGLDSTCLGNRGMPWQPWHALTAMALPWQPWHVLTAMALP
jgi:hypothetical protein